MFKETLGENYSEDNPYRILVDKYEALLKIQQKHNAFTSTCAMPPSTTKDNHNQGISLHEELQMSGQFSSFNGNASEDSDDDGDDEVAVTGKRASGGGDGDGGGNGVTAAAAQCKYSETDTTSSSGFSDETSNKCTQTAETAFFTAGSFLCTISDGDDCRFSIYDDASPVESRFRKTPEYRQLFREIFAVLKRAAEAKDEGERLPLLQDDETCGRDLPPAPPKVPPVTPACEHNPLVAQTEDAAAAADERCPTTASEHEDEQRQRPEPPPHDAAGRGRPEPEHTRCRRDIIEELASAVKHKKHARHRKSTSKQQSRDISHLMDFKWSDQKTCRPRGDRAADGGGDRTSSHRAAAAWCAPKDGGGEDAATSDSPGREPAPSYASSASQEVAKLKLLEKSYAEVLRLTKPPSNRPQSQYFNRM